MKITIKDFCIRCGLCEDLYPELFIYNFEKDKIDTLYVEIPDNLISRAKSAATDCAVAAIHLKAQNN